MSRRRYADNPQFENNPYTPNVTAQQAAESYCLSMGFPPPQPTPYVKVNEEVSRQIAKVYGQTPDMSDDPDVWEAYRQLAEETFAQFSTLPVQIVFTEGDPYHSSQEMMDDVLNNNRLVVFSGGADHNILTREQNNQFRAVHDYYGHAQHGFAFGPRGEENAWVSHSKMFSPLARAAMTTETRGQNSWVNFGPYSKLPVQERPFAEQKAFLLPPEFQTRPELQRAYTEYPEFYPMQNPAKKKKFVDPTAILPGYELIEEQLAEEAAKASRKRGEYRKPQSCVAEGRIQRIKRFFRNGQSGIGWYQQTNEVIEQLFDGDKERGALLILLLGATSPMMDVKGNLDQALKALKMVDAGIQFGDERLLEEYDRRIESGERIGSLKPWSRIWLRAFLSVHVPNIRRAALRRDLRGPKVEQFAHALAGDVMAVTVDRWIMRAFRMGHDTPLVSEYRCIERAITKLAAQAEVAPRDYQAAAWTGIKLLEGDPEDTTDPFEVALTKKLQAGQSYFSSKGFQADPYSSVRKRLPALAGNPYNDWPPALPPDDDDDDVPEEEMLSPGPNGEYVLTYDPTLLPPSPYLA